MRRLDPAYVALERAKSRAWRAANPEKAAFFVRDATLKKKYGFGVEEYNRLLASQDGRCAICGTTDAKSKNGGSLHVDHCHATGKVRGLLCQGCNTTLGKMQDSPALLRKAADYIERGGVPSAS